MKWFKKVSKQNKNNLRINKMKQLQFVLLTLAFSLTVSAKEYHVAKTGNDANNGNLETPLLTIQAAANLAQSGDIITAHEGIYRQPLSLMRRCSCSCRCACTPPAPSRAFSSAGRALA